MHEIHEILSCAYDLYKEQVHRKGQLVDAVLMLLLGLLLWLLLGLLSSQLMSIFLNSSSSFCNATW
jgi:hypothetical protein